MSGLIFPKEFIWGTATSAYQIEGGFQEDGKGESVWDRFTHLPGKIKNGDNGDVACDHYHRYEQDVQLLKDLGVKSYQFSISWPRIFPDGVGPPNPKGLDFYRKLIHRLIENGIIPMVTLYHWDLPQKLQDRGGWAVRETATYFKQYARYLFKELGELVPYWITINEPWVSAFTGYWYGGHPPQIKDLPTALLASHHLMLAHGMGVRAFKELGMKGQIGIKLNLNPVYPASEAQQDIAAAARYGEFLNGWFLDPILKGAYPANLTRWLADYVKNPDISKRDLEMIHAPIDFLGINNYSSTSVLYDPDKTPLQYAFANTGKPRTDSGWEIYPEGLYDLLIYLHNTYPGIKLAITENGGSFRDVVDQDGAVIDHDRIRYLHEHLFQVHRALQAGVNLLGYYVWSFLDNFEWNLGYSKRFGLVYVNFVTQKRMIKASGAWYREVIQKNRIMSPGEPTRVSYV